MDNHNKNGFEKLLISLLRSEFGEEDKAMARVGYLCVALGLKYGATAGHETLCMYRGNCIYKKLARKSFDEYGPNFFQFCRYESTERPRNIVDEILVEHFSDNHLDATLDK